MKGRLSKVSLLFLALVLALSGVGAAFAAWTASVTISGTATTGELDWEFQGPVIHLDQGLDPNCFFDLFDGTWVTMDKDVATTTVTIVAPDTLEVTVDNAYPYYGEHIAFKFHGLGTIPLKFWKVNYTVDGIVVDTQYDSNEYKKLDLDDDGVDDLEIWYGDSFGEQFHYCDKADISFELLVLQTAPQSSTLKFNMEFIGIQWNEYQPEDVPGACEKFD